MSRLKLLRDEVETVDEDGLKIGVKVISTSQQARVLDLYSRAYDAEGKAALFAFILNHCLASVSIDGTKYVPAELAETANIADDETFTTLKQISDMAMASMGIEIIPDTTGLIEDAIESLDEEQKPSAKEEEEKK